MDLNSKAASSVTLGANKKKSNAHDKGRQEIFGSMVDEFSRNAYVSKDGKLELNVTNLNFFISLCVHVGRFKLL